MALPDITRISPHKTPGWPTGEPHVIIVHGTRGGAAYGVEFAATLRWFDNDASKVSAHWVIARDGTTARVVPDSHRAWHAAEHNEVAIGIELEQPKSSDQITTLQYEKLALIGRTFYPSIPMVHLTTVNRESGWIEHMETPQGIRVGKSDVGTFDWQVFLQEDDMLTPEEHGWLSAIHHWAKLAGPDKIDHIHAHVHNDLPAQIKQAGDRIVAAVAAIPNNQLSASVLRDIVREELDKTKLTS